MAHVALGGKPLGWQRTCSTVSCKQQPTSLEKSQATHPKGIQKKCWRQVRWKRLDIMVRSVVQDPYKSEEGQRRGFLCILYLCIHSWLFARTPWKRQAGSCFPNNSLTRDREGRMLRGLPKPCLEMLGISIPLGSPSTGWLVLNGKLACAGPHLCLLT